jgi:drug/metabolite transporter (DMT)-like permease
MTWFLAAILAYFFLAIVSLFDRYFLVGPIPEPKVYAFWVGILSFLGAFLLIPFGIHLPAKNLILIGLIAGFIRIFATLFLYKGIRRGEVSRTVPAINGFLPIFTFLIFFLFLPSAESLNLFHIIAFVLLVGGSVLISLKKISFDFSDFSLSARLKNLKYPAIGAFLFSLNFFLTKNIFLKTDFLSGLFPMLMGVGLGAASFFISPGFRKSFMVPKISFKLSGLIVLAQIFGALAVFLQFYSIFLGKPSQVPLINALEGTRDVFLLLFVFILSRWRPNLLKEKMAGAVGFQKTLSVLFIAGGLAILALK